MTNKNEEIPLVGTSGEPEIIKGRFSVSGYPIQEVDTAIPGEMVIDFDTGELGIANDEKEVVSFSAEMAKESFLQKIKHSLLTDFGEYAGELYELSEELIRFPSKVLEGEKLFSNGLELETSSKFVLFIPSIGDSNEVNVELSVTNRTNQQGVHFTTSLLELQKLVLDSSTANVEEGINDYIIEGIEFDKPVVLYANPVLFKIQ